MLKGTGFRIPRREAEEFAEQERQESAKQRLAEDREQYEKHYVAGLKHQQRGIAPALQIKPLDFEVWRKFAPQDENDPVLRGIHTTNRALTSQANQVEAAEVKSGRRDPAWTLPDNAKNLKMSDAQALDFAQGQADAFITNNPEYYPCKANFDAMSKYLSVQGVTLPTEECWWAAWRRLRQLGKIIERPPQEPEPLPQAEPQPVEQAAQNVNPQLVDGWDPETGEPRQFAAWEIDKMGADEYRRAFKVTTRFTRSRFAKSRLPGE